jgi:hypothetical protein
MGVMVVGTGAGAADSGKRCCWLELRPGSDSGRGADKKVLSISCVD